MTPSESNSQRSPLHRVHLAAGARMVDFAGWEMPVQYTGILDEHRAVREDVGVFDISHMGEFFVSGPNATSWLDRMLTNAVTRLGIGEAQYSLMLNESGGVIDDLILYRTGESAYLLIVNAAKIDEDAAWMRGHLGDGVEFQDQSADYGAVAVQGPKAAALFEKLFGFELPVERNRVLYKTWTETPVWIVTTGYTGESGFECVVPTGQISAFWAACVDAGAKPCGLGARDTLRLEMCYPLNGSDLSPTRTPLEAGLGFFVDLTKPDFIGKAALESQKSSGISARLMALAATEKSPPIRSHYPVWIDGKVVGETSSGALSPSLGIGIAMAYIPVEFAKVGQTLEIEVRGKTYPAIIKKKPLYIRAS